MTRTLSLAVRIEALGHDERRILECLLARLELGRAQYGDWNVHDGRDYRQEATEELLDGMMYLAAELVKG